MTNICLGDIDARDICPGDIFRLDISPPDICQINFSDQKKIPEKYFFTPNFGKLVSQASSSLELRLAFLSLGVQPPSHPPGQVY